MKKIVKKMNLIAAISAFIAAIFDFMVGMPALGCVLIACTAFNIICYEKQ